MLNAFEFLHFKFPGGMVDLCQLGEQVSKDDDAAQHEEHAHHSLCKILRRNVSEADCGEDGGDKIRADPVGFDLAARCAQVDGRVNGLERFHKFCHIILRGGQDLSEPGEARGQVDGAQYAGAERKRLMH